jgi:hypothetical protein
MDAVAGFFGGSAAFVLLAGGSVGGGFVHAAAAQAEDRNSLSLGVEIAVNSRPGSGSGLTGAGGVAGLSGTGDAKGELLALVDEHDTSLGYLKEVLDGVGDTLENVGQWVGADEGLGGCDQTFEAAGDLVVGAQVLEVAEDAPHLGGYGEEGSVFLDGPVARGAAFEADGAEHATTLSHGGGYTVDFVIADFVDKLAEIPCALHENPERSGILAEDFTLLGE